MSKENKSEVKVEKFISYDEAINLTDVFGGMGGFFKEGMRWQDYIATVKDERKVYAEAMREYIIANNSKGGGDWHQSEDDGVPLFSDGGVATFSYRAWGDIMAAIWSSELHRDFHYMSFYMSPTELEKI